MIDLLVTLLIVLLIVGLAYWVAAQFLPEPLPKLVLVVGVVVLILLLVAELDERDRGASAAVASPTAHIFKPCVSHLPRCRCWRRLLERR